jgi:hypothetical protein
MNLLSHKVHPTPGAYAAEPLTAAEIDVLPNADRVWATILSLRAEFSREAWRGDFPSRLEAGS